MQLLGKLSTIPRSLLLLLLTVLLVTGAVMDDGLDVLNNKPTERIENVKQNTGCNIYANEGLHVVLDRICTLCHEMYSDTNPNMRSQCRLNCFRNEQFKKCLLVFRPARSLHRRDVLRQNW